MTHLRFRELSPETVAAELLASIPEMQRQLALIEEAKKVSPKTLRYEVTI